MKILITSDWHLSNNPRDRYRLDYISTLPKLIKQHAISDVFFLGDLTEDKDWHPSSFVNHVADIIVSISKTAPLVMLEGNHDRQDDGDAFFRFLRHIHGIKWIDVPTQYKNFTFLPYTHNYKRDWKDILFSDTVFAHNTFEGTRERGRTYSGIPLETFKRAKIISGDVHTPQTIKNNNVSVEYCGAPYTIDFGDAYQGRILIWDGGEVRQIFTESVNKRLIEISGIDELPQKTRTFNAGDIVKVRVKLRSRDKAEWANIVRSVEAYCHKRNFELHLPVVSEIQNIGRKVSRDVEATSIPDDKLVQDFAKRRGEDKATAKVGIDLL